MFTVRPALGVTSALYITRFIATSTQIYVHKSHQGEFISVFHTFLVVHSSPGKSLIIFSDCFSTVFIGEKTENNTVDS